MKNKSCKGYSQSRRRSSRFDFRELTRM